MSTIKNLFLLSLAGNILMVIARILHSGNFDYVFLLWNLLLAAIPLLISRRLYHSLPRNRIFQYIGLFFWLLFLPNAPYIVTDLVHLHHRPPVPFWYDMLLLVLSACNGLALGFQSIRYIELILFVKNARRYLVFFRISIILSMSYGVYLGRYLRCNSWDAIFNPIEVLEKIMESLTLSAIGFVLTFSFVIFIMYGFFQAILQRRFQEVS